MRIAQILNEEYDAARARAALTQGMSKLADVICELLSSKNLARYPENDPERLRALQLNFYRSIYDKFFDEIYQAYMRKNFENTPLSFTEKQWSDIVNEFKGKLPVEYKDISSEDNSNFWQFDNVQKSNRDVKRRSELPPKDPSRYRKGKIYFTLRRDFRIDQLPGVMKNLLQYIQDPNTQSACFKICDRNIGNEADSLCVYTMFGADTNKIYNDIKRIFPSTQRYHRGDTGVDDDKLEYGRDVLKVGLSYKESDSGVRQGRFVQFLWQSRAVLTPMAKANKKQQLRDLLVDVWLKKFERGDMSNPILPLKADGSTGTTSSTPINDRPLPGGGTGTGGTGGGGGKPVTGALTLQGAAGTDPLKLNLTVEIGRRVVERFGLESRFYSNPQFQLRRDADQGWSLVPSPGATNATMINGAKVTGAQKLRVGDVISVGNSQRLPLRVA
jgi:hypothetical protein